MLKVTCMAAALCASTIVSSAKDVDMEVGGSVNRLKETSDGEKA